jgi:hypothetical protein
MISEETTDTKNFSGDESASHLDAPGHGAFVANYLA